MKINVIIFLTVISFFFEINNTEDSPPPIIFVLPLSRVETLCSALFSKSWTGEMNACLNLENNGKRFFITIKTVCIVLQEYSVFYSQKLYENDFLCMFVQIYNFLVSLIFNQCNWTQRKTNDGMMGELYHSKWWNHGGKPCKAQYANTHIYLFLQIKCKYSVPLHRLENVYKYWTLRSVALLLWMSFCSNNFRYLREFQRWAKILLSYKNIFFFDYKQIQK